MSLEHFASIQQIKSSWHQRNKKKKIEARSKKWRFPYYQWQFLTGMSLCLTGHLQSVNHVPSGWFPRREEKHYCLSILKRCLKKNHVKSAVNLSYKPLLVNCRIREIYFSSIKIIILRISFFLEQAGGFPFKRLDFLLFFLFCKKTLNDLFSYLTNLNSVSLQIKV